MKKQMNNTINIIAITYPYPLENNKRRRVVFTYPTGNINTKTIAALYKYMQNKKPLIIKPWLHVH